jgi:hypothetical protein
MTSRDTAPEIARRQLEMAMALPEAQRLRMASGMFDSARRILISDLQARKVPREKWPGEIFRRVYGPDFRPETAERIAARLDEKAAGYGG